VELQKYSKKINFIICFFANRIFGAKDVLPGGEDWEMKILLFFTPWLLLDIEKIPLHLYNVQMVL
jgi:hypothetical protein